MTESLEAVASYNRAVANAFLANLIRETEDSLGITYRPRHRA